MGDSPPQTISVGTNTDKRKHITYEEINRYIQSTYNPPERNDSIICDILAMYLVGQKILYTESKTYCEQRLNFLMLPAIFVTTLCTMLSVVLKDYNFGSTIVSVLSGGNAFLLALISYLKLDAKAEAHRTSSYKFDKLHSEVVFQSGKILLSRSSPKALEDIMNKVETAIRDINETNQFIIPEAVRYNFPKTYSMNIFSEVKCIQNNEILCINELKDVIDSIKDFENKNIPTTDEEDLKKLLEQKRKLLTDQFIRIQTEYFDIDDEFEKELARYRRKVKGTFQLCGWLKI
jgi:hypothetical protein